MKYRINRELKTPAYMQIYEQLKQDILSGGLEAGTKLPSKRLMAEELGLSVITVEHAYALLEDEAYIHARQRSGYFVTYGGVHPTSAPARRAALEEMSAAHDGPGEDFPFSTFAKTMRKVLSDYGPEILVKSPNSGCFELRQAISAYLWRSRGIIVEAERIIIGSGAEYLYSLVVQLLGRENSFALEDPSYEKIRRVYQANGADCVLLKMAPDGIDSRELAACTAKALHVTPFNSFPSGISASASKRREYADWARKNEAYIIEDDYDSEFASPTKQVETIFSLAPEWVIYLNTFSKTLAPAMRMGFMVLPERLMQEFSKRLDFYSCTVPVYEQYVLAEFIGSGHLERYINRRRRKQRRL